MGKQWKQWEALFSWAPKSLQMVTAAMKLKDPSSLEVKLWPTQTAYYKAETLLCQQGSISQSYDFSSSHVWVWELDHKEDWTLKNWCFWIVAREKTLESPLDCKEIQSVHPKGDPSWVFIGKTDVEAETPILWPPDGKSWLIWKDPDAGRDWRREQKGMTEDEMIGWHHRLNGHEFELILGVGDGQGGLTCCSPWGCKESDMTEGLKWTELNWWWSWASLVA